MLDANNLLLIVDDDAVFLGRLERSMARKGFNIITAASIGEARNAIAQKLPTHAIVDLRLGDGSGLDIVEELHRANPEAAIIILTSYGAIATAVAAVKMGAVEYLSKPASDAEDIYDALMGLGGKKPATAEKPMSAERVRWEHIQKIYEMSGRNVSETARQLGMHRRTLQRILAKRAPNEQQGPD